MVYFDWLDKALIDEAIETIDALKITAVGAGAEIVRCLNPTLCVGQTGQSRSMTDRKLESTPSKHDQPSVGANVS
jgi:hypothetical protein